MNELFVRSLSRRWSLLSGASLMLLLLAALPARADLSIQITQGVTAPIAIAVVPFAQSQGPWPVDAASVIEADLARSGRFAPLAHGSFLQSPSTASSIDFASWRMVKVDYLVIGRQVIGTANTPAVEFELYSVLTGARLLGLSLPAGNTNVRAAAHRAADLIYENIIGVKGAFATRIAYVLVEGQIPNRRYRLIVADADGENTHVVAESREPLMSPAWSPDGTSLAYVSFESRFSAIYVQTLATGERHRVAAREGINGAPAWSPDGLKLAFTGSTRDGNVDVYVCTVSSGQIQRITDDPAIDTEPVWTVDGRGLYFTSDRSGRPQIYLLSPLVAGQKPARVTFEGPYNARARVSSDGSQLAVITQDQGAYRLAAVDAKSGQGRVITRGTLDLSPSFAPNGQSLIYSTRERGRGVLATVSVDGSISSRLSAPEGDIRDPAWSPF